MPALGHRGYLGIAKEATWGTYVAPTEFIEIESETIKKTIASKIIKGINSTRVMTKRVQLGEKVGGQMVWEVNAEDGIGLLLKQTLPSETFIDDGVGNGGQHLFVPGSALVPGFSALIDRDSATGPIAANIWKATGGRVKSLQLSASDGETLKATLEASFQDLVSGGTGVAPVYTTQNPLVYHTGSFTVDGSAVPIKSFSLSLATGLLDARGKIGSKLIQQQQPGPYGVSGEIEAYFDDMTLVDKYRNGSAAAIVLDLTGALIGTTTRRLKVEIPTAFFNGETPNLGGADSEIMLKIPFEAVRTGGGSPDEMIRLTLNNSRRSAY